VDPVGAAEPVPEGEDRALDELRAALEESEARYLAVATALADGITLHDAGGRIVSANASAAGILGVPEAELTGLAGLSLSDPVWGCIDSGEEPLRPEDHPVSLALGGEPTARALVGMHDRQGELHWLLMTALRIPSGNTARAVCLFADVTFSRLEEEHRGRTEMSFRTLIERTPEGVAVYQNNALAYANEKMVSLLGYDTVDEMLDRPPADLVHPDDRAMLAREMESVEAQPTAPAEERLLRRDGAAVPVEVTMIATFFNGAPATLVHARDLTERKRLEAQVVMADRLASVGRLAAAVGHEINNPLAYVMANLDLALEWLGVPGISLGGGSDEEPDRLGEILEMLREAREGADRVRHIVRDLKVFSRGEAEERTRVDPRQVLDSCVNMARGEIRQRARVVKDYGDTPPVLVNQARLGQVLLNLLINAAHAVPEGDPDANEIRVTTRTDDRGNVVIEVKDTGAGIPDDVKPRIFEPFFTTKAGKSGTGLGLSICQNIVTALGGQIAFESEVGKGTTFQVILPPAPLESAPPGG
jgi:PAS domain S-box-containing protein